MSFSLLILDYKTDTFEEVKRIAAKFSEPFFTVSKQPFSFFSGLQNYFSSRDKLLDENARLYSEALVMNAKLQKLVSLTAENVRLRELLGSSTVVEDNVLVAETIGISPNPFEHVITINKGEEDGVYAGQAVIDAYGLLGQVKEVAFQTSKVIMISDARHAIPVQVNRNEVHAIAEGTGRVDRLVLPNMVETSDIKAGDLLVSSGLGQRFPVGYPVGVVESVESDPSRDFLKIIVRPSAKLGRGRHVLLVFANDDFKSK